MAYFSLHAYDADVWVREFRGLNQADVMMNPDPRFATEEENLETIHGVLQPQSANDIMTGPDNGSAKVETLAVMHRRWYTGAGDRNWYICSAGGILYQKQKGDGGGWVPIPMPEGVEAFTSNVWSWVTYEINPSDTTVDVLLLSNASDGMYMITPPDTNTLWSTMKTTKTWGGAKDMTWGEVKAAKWTVEPVETRTDPEDDSEPQKKFAVIERFQERIWGCGVPDHPDSLFYSRAYDPTDWTPDTDIPENGAGQIDQPTFDGDQFFALKRFGDQLLSFKKNRIFRVYGVGPADFVFNEQFAEGTEFFNTIAVHGERVYMAGRNGLSVYDGMSSAPYAREQVEQIWKGVNKDALDQMCSAFHDNRYYFAFPTGDSAVNNAMLIYDMTEGSILLFTDFCIESFLPADDELFATSSTLPGKIIRMKYDSWTNGEATGAKTKWVSPWMDFGYKRIQKGGFDFYFLPEVQDEAVEFSISIQTEKKCKTKQYTCQPLTEEQRAIPKEHRMKRLHFGGMGRKFRIIIETASGVTAPWRIVGGLQLVVETDPD